MIQLITWVDHAAPPKNTWYALETIKEEIEKDEVFEVKSVGWLVGESKHTVTLALNWSANDQLSNIMQIDKRLITDRIDIEEPSLTAEEREIRKQMDLEAAILNSRSRDR